MRPGAIIEYRLSLFRFPFRWRTVIEVFEPGSRFIDVQANGPYALWRHLHEFVDVPGGTMIRDRVEYALPLGPLGELAHALFVRRQLEQIFDYRRSVIERDFAREQDLPPQSAATPR
ncbi:MAG TPA: SRPBCC family protein [Polyangia bacterium]|nr:SRPBCC family protein [Polyangia bacterium]